MKDLVALLYDPYTLYNGLTWHREDVRARTSQPRHPQIDTIHDYPAPTYTVQLENKVRPMARESEVGSMAFDKSESRKKNKKPKVSKIKSELLKIKPIIEAKKFHDALIKLDKFYSTYWDDDLYSRYQPYYEKYVNICNRRLDKLLRKDDLCSIE